VTEARTDPIISTSHCLRTVGKIFNCLLRQKRHTRTTPTAVAEHELDLELRKVY